MEGLLNFKSGSKLIIGLLIENFLEHIIWSGFLENDIGNFIKAFNENPENFHKKKIVLGIAFIFYVYTSKVLS